jgi:hypothetical protein
MRQQAHHGSFTTSRLHPRGRPPTCAESPRREPSVRRRSAGRWCGGRQRAASADRAAVLAAHALRAGRVQASRALLGRRRSPASRGRAAPGGLAARGPRRPRISAAGDAARARRAGRRARPSRRGAAPPSRPRSPASASRSESISAVSSIASYSSMGTSAAGGPAVAGPDDVIAAVGDLAEQLAETGTELAGGDELRQAASVRRCVRRPQRTERPLAPSFTRRDWAPVPKRRRNRPQRPLDVAHQEPTPRRRTTCTSEQSALLGCTTVVALIALHTREVAGSKPAAPIIRKVRTSGPFVVERRCRWVAPLSIGARVSTR